MNTKLTLTIEKGVIEKAKRYAKKEGRSLSDIIENYLKVITDEPNDPDLELTPIVKSLKGAFRSNEKFDYKEELTEVLSSKYLSK